MVQHDGLPSPEPLSVEDAGYQKGKLIGTRYPYLTIDEQNRHARDDMRHEGLPYTTTQWQYIKGWLKGYADVGVPNRQ
ncbi:MAG: hypothetical protein ACLQUY_25335 [Ktedonobacterales bacterium]